MKYTYDSHFRSSREDGRIRSAQASFLETMRRREQELSLPKELTKESFLAWQKEIRAKATELLKMPPFTPQPKPRLLSTTPREGYRVEKWEFYPDEVSAVSVLMLVPDSATEETPAPGVFCFPGSNQSKELFSGEPKPSFPAGGAYKYEDRNCMGKHYAKNGMIAVVFDPLGIGETALDLEDPNYGWHSRTNLTYQLLEYGYTYTGYSVFQALSFLSFFKTLPFVDAGRIATSGHSLGSEVAIYAAMVSDDIHAVVFNDFLSNPGDRHVSLTEFGSMEDMLHLCQTFHLIPGNFRYFGFEDLCAALAPRYLAMNEGGAEEYTEDVRRAFAVMEAEDHMALTHYPVYQDPSTRTHHHPMPRYGLTQEEYFAISYVNAPDHSFRAAPSVALLKKCFGL